MDPAPILVQTAHWSGWHDYSVELPKRYDHKKGKGVVCTQVDEPLALIP